MITYYNYLLYILTHSFIHYYVENRRSKCPNDCNRHGVCAYGLLDEYGRSMSKCECMGGWTGDDCSVNIQCKVRNNT